jgi:Cu-Zn family superoxide dismutase
MESVMRNSERLLACAIAALLIGCQRESADQGARLAPPDAQIRDRGAAPAADTAPPPVALAAPPRPDAVALPRTVARAELMPTAGSDVHGTVDFAESGNTVTLDITLSGLTPGPHGMHVHEFGDCSAADASSAGKHLNPHSAPHGGPADESDARHPGDLGNVVADEMGNVRTSIHDAVLDSEPDFQIVGHALVVHAGTDDLKSQPAGNSGNPVACGVIEPAPSGVPLSAPAQPSAGRG